MITCAWREGETAEDVRVRELISLLFGSDQVELQLTSRGGSLIVTIAADQAWRAGLISRAGGDGDLSGLPDDLATMLDHTRGASPGFVYQLDLAGIQRNLMVLMANHMGLESSGELDRFDAVVGAEPVTVSAYGALAGNRWTAGFEVDFDRMMALVEMAK